ncbi:MAG: PHB depolymerase family esterase [Vicinamibacteria bacterium]
MRSPVSAIAWEFRQRHRLALITLAIYVAVLTLFWIFVLGPDRPLRLFPPNGLAATLVVPFSTTFMYLLAVFSFGLDGDMAARPSIYPNRMFTLPVTTSALAGWPMLLGGTAVAGLWLCASLFFRSAGGQDVPLIWPALLGAVFLAWTQVLSWSSYPLPGLRIVAAVLWLASLDAAVILAVEYEISELRLVAMLLPQLPLAYFAARFVVARARRGYVPDWSGVFARAFQFVRLRGPRAKSFRSPESAQLWFEWRQEGWILPLSVLMVLPFELGFLYICRNEPPVMTFEALLLVLLTPPFLAGFAGAIAGGAGREGSDARGAMFRATRPLTSAALVAAKFRMAMWSTLLTWLLVLVSLEIGLKHSASWPRVAGWISDTIDVAGRPHAAVLSLLIIAGLLASTWKQLVQSLYIRLAGRDWLVRTSVVMRLSMLVVLFPLLDSFFRKEGVFAFVWDNWPWALAVLVVLKMSAANWILPRLHRSHVITDRTLLTGTASWLALVLLLYGLLVWLISTPPLVPRYGPILLAILSVPLARISAAPLALAWSRHGGEISNSQDTARHSGNKTLGMIRVLIGVPAAILVFEAASFDVSSRNNGTIVSSGEKREYLLYVPHTYDPAKSTPLVISMHGAGLWPTAERDISLWNAVAERNGFIVVYPSAISRGPRAWHMGRSSVARNVRFISDLIDALKAGYNIDSTRIYADGLSNGGGMAFVLSCMSERIAAVGLVASAQLLPFDWCKDERAVPMISFHGTADRAALYHGGKSWAAPVEIPDVQAFTASWASRNRCASVPTDSAVARDVIRRSYTDCADNAAVVLYTVKDGGHSWPSGGLAPEWLIGRTTRSIDATSLMWAFYREHHKKP